MPNRLTDLEITEVSFVDRPANPESKIMLFKRDTTGVEESIEITPTPEVTGATVQFPQQWSNTGSWGSATTGNWTTDLELMWKGDPDSSDVYVEDTLPEKKKRKKKKLEKTEEEEYPQSDSPERNISMPDDEMFSAEYVEKLEDKVLDLEDRLSALQAENEALAKGQNEDGPEDILKSADPAVRELVEKAQAEAAEAIALAKAERDARVRREYIDKADRLGGLTIETGELADLMREVGEVNADLGKKLETVLTAANEAAAVGKLYEEIGSGSVAPNSAEERIHKAALAKSEETGISYEAAYDRVLEEQPDLYTNVLSEGGR